MARVDNDQTFKFNEEELQSLSLKCLSLELFHLMIDN